MHITTRHTRRNRLPHLAGSIVWRSRWGRRFRLPVEADFHRHPNPENGYAPAAEVLCETLQRVWPFPVTGWFIRWRRLSVETCGGGTLLNFSTNLAFSGCR